MRECVITAGSYLLAAVISVVALVAVAEISSGDDAPSWASLES